MHVPCTHAERSGTHLSPFCTHLLRVCTHRTFPTAALHARTHVRAACHALFTVPDLNLPDILIYVESNKSLVNFCSGGAEKTGEVQKM